MAKERQCGLYKYQKIRTFMNTDVLLLFANAFIAVLIAAIFVIRIIVREYLPRIREYQNKEKENSSRA